VYRAARALWRRRYYARTRRRMQSGLPSFRRIEQAVRERESRPATGRPIVLVSISARTRTVSFSGATHLLLGWALRLVGRKVIYYSCRRSLPKCVLHVRPSKPKEPPPCDACEALSDALLPPQHARTWNRWPEEYDADLTAWLAELETQTLDALRHVSFEGLPLGELAWPALMWALRVGDPAKNPAAPWILARYIAGAAQLARDFRRFVEETHPEVVVVFNGLFYPEAVAAAVARERGIRVVTYEFGFRAGSVHFSHEQATRYDIRVPDDFQMGKKENDRLDEHLAERFKGEFTMGGVRFWPEMKDLDSTFLRKADQFRQLVPVFTNVIFDTSQSYSNVCFRNMFDWLEATMAIARDTPDTLFVVRAHPDESRSGKESHEPVGEWLRDRGWLARKNVAFVGPDDYLSSYRLIQRARCVLVYNSTIGLEAAMMGTPTFSGGLARYCRSGAAAVASTPAEYRRKLAAFLAADPTPPDQRQQQLARRYYYYTFYKACIDLSHFLGAEGMVFALTFGNVEDLLPDHSQEMKILTQGIVEGTPFLYP